ncbi:hypothetical protein [Rhodothermus profundi]|nr:hypothetical protein [Rhodothermus profundi]
MMSQIKRKPALRVIFTWMGMVIFLLITRFVFHYYDRSVRFYDIMFSAINTSTFVVIGVMALKSYLELLGKQKSKNKHVYFFFATVLSLIAFLRLIFNDLDNILSVINDKTDFIIIAFGIASIFIISYVWIYYMWKVGCKKTKRHHPFFPDIEAGDSSPSG